jgi:hypothetical protein
MIVSGTELFKSEIFRERRCCNCGNYIGKSDFKHKILDDVRRKIIRNLGLRFTGREGKKHYYMLWQVTAICLEQR